MNKLIAPPLSRFATALMLGALLHSGGATAFAEGHRFACADYTQGKVFIVDTNGSVEWDFGHYRMATCSSPPATA